MDVHDLDNITFEAMPKGMHHVDEPAPEKSRIFFILLVIIIILFGGYWFYQEKYLVQQQSFQPVTPTPQKSEPLSQTPTPDLSTLQNDLGATVITDYSSLF